MAPNAPWSAHTTTPGTSIAAATWAPDTLPGSSRAAARTAAIGLSALAVVVADAAPAAKRSQMQTAVPTMSATETPWSSHTSADQCHGTNGANGSSTRQFVTYSTPMSWRAG